MAKILIFDTARKKITTINPSADRYCHHKRVTAYTLYRTVRCATCGRELDPFDVLVDILNSHPPSDGDLEEKRMNREMARRIAKKDNKDSPGRK